MSDSKLRREALLYHAKPSPGKIQVIPREQLKELFALATPISENRKEFAYLELNIPGENEFATIKEDKKALPRYSKFMNINPKIKSRVFDSNLTPITKQDIIKILLNKLNNKINVLKHQKYNNNNNNNVEYILNDGDYIGTVKFFNEARGFGFITEKTTKKEFFIHKSNLCEVIKENDLVIFNIIKGRKKGQKAANNVEIFDKNNNKHIKQN